MSPETNGKSNLRRWFGGAHFVWALLVPTVASAEPISDIDVTSAVETWVRHVTADARPDAAVARLEPHVVDGQTTAYIAHLTGGGYCLCGADDLTLPVYLYRPEGTYDPTNPNYEYILSQITTRLHAVQEAKAQKSRELDQYEPELARRAAYWDDLIARRVPKSNTAEGSRATPTSMSVRLNSYWHQGSPYNDQCPVLEPGTDERCVVGCVATTAAQIMYYWQWPNTGTGSGSVEYDRRYRVSWDSEPLTPDPNLLLTSYWDDRLYWTSAAGGLLYMSGIWDSSVLGKAKQKCNGAVDCENEDYWDALGALWGRLFLDPTTCAANFGSTTYNWSILEDDHTDDTIDSGDVEVAELSYHAGIAVGMHYGRFVSLAGMIRDGIVDHFRYDSDASKVDRDVDTMVEEIQWLRPFEITGKGDGDIGHSWTVCGYNQNTSPWQFLMNIGWGGGSTEWYSVDEVYPNKQRNTIRIAPEEGVKFVGGGTRGDGSPDSPISSLEAALDSVADDTLLIMKAGTTHTLPVANGYATLDKPVKLTGHAVIITPE